MSSFTYKIWSDEPLSNFINKFIEVFEKIGFFLANPATKKLHCWLEEEYIFDVANLNVIHKLPLPFGLQWWRGEEDLYVGFDIEEKFGGHVARVVLYGFDNREKAEVAKLMIENILPEKEKFPQDYSVFEITAE